jgi:hypothetical protein
MKNTITRRTAFGLGAGLLAAPAIVSAQGNWPTGPIRFIGLFPTGREYGYPVPHLVH